MCKKSMRLNALDLALENPEGLLKLVMGLPAGARRQALDDIDQARPELYTYASSSGFCIGPKGGSMFVYVVGDFS